ncbi:hypothetical protein SMC7_00635 [Candidatus Cryosericum terrychapinii]|uniref:PTS EIIB type-2 domain-containing protein n=1 Tax=Candidatus Cryosericum terrychapinii TaxID=2290919 RepID=A0A398D3E8_9BACT|nr:hypothetical protein SMC7_00635 [Candidatus Cryosericum terrychapinii]
MGHQYLIYVACGNAAASASLVGSRLSELLKAEKIETRVETMRVVEVAGHVATKRPALVVITAGSVFSREGLPGDLPVMSGLPLMTMVGVGDFIKKVKEALHLGA